MPRVAFIVDELFEESEFRVPYDELRRAGHEVVIVGSEAGKRVQGKRGKEQVSIECSVDETGADRFDALVIPGGYSPDKLRTDARLVRFTRDFSDAGKPLAAICHAGSMLIEAKVTEGRTVTSWPSIKTDLMNAGAYWVDREVVEDGNLITSRKADDLPAFTAALLRQLAGRIPERMEPPRSADTAEPTLENAPAATPSTAHHARA